MKIISVWDSRSLTELTYEQFLASNGHELVTFAENYQGDASDTPIWMKTVNSGKFNNLPIFHSIRLRNFLRRKHYYASIKKQIKLLSPDVLICNFGQVGSEFAKFCSKNKLPLLVFFYGHDISAALMSPRWRRKYQVFRELNGLAIVLCETAKERLIKIGCPSDRIVVCNLPLNLDFPRANLRESMKLRLITAGRFIEKKGYPTLFDALAKVKENGIDFEIEIFGYGSEFHRVERMSRAKGLEDRIIWRRDLIGKQFNSEFLKSLDNSDLFILCAVAAENGDDEGGPSLSLVTAQAKGVPIITTDFPGHEISVIDQKTGFVCKGDYATEISSCIIAFIEERSKYRAIGEAGAMIARKEFDYLDQSEKIETLLSSLSGKA